MAFPLYVEQVSLARPIPEDNYLYDLPVVRHLKENALAFSSPVTFLVGENGTGKSTLTEALAVAMGFNPEGGTRNFCFSTADSHSDLHRYLRVVKGYVRPRDGFFLRAESFFNVATNIEELDKQPAAAPSIIDSYGGLSLHKQSHGESFMALVQNRFGGNGLYLLDEPEAALSPMRLMELLCHIQRLVKNNSQFIISTHSPILMAFPGAEVFELSKEGVKRVSYKDTEHFLVTKQFLNDPDRMLRYLLQEE